MVENRELDDKTAVFTLRCFYEREIRENNESNLTAFSAYENEAVLEA